MLQKEILMVEKISQAKSEFLSRMSHELRTPLNAILGFGQLLILTGENLEEKQKKNINDILKAGNHILILINDVLNLSEIESGQEKIKLSTVDVNNVGINNSLVIAEPVRLKQVMLNLLKNAVKYNKDN